MKKINELTGFRDPNACEKEFIGQYFEKVFQHQMKTYMGLSIIFCVIGIFCVSACSVRGFLSLVIGLIAFILAFGTLRTKKKYLNNIQLKSQQDSPDNVRRGMRLIWNTGSGYTFPPLPGSCPPGYS